MKEQTMFFGVAVRGWWALPLLAVLAVVWVLWKVIVLAGMLVVLVVQAFAPAAAAGVVGLLGRADARGADRLETAAERHTNGREKRQEREAAAALRLGRW